MRGGSWAVCVGPGVGGSRMWVVGLRSGLLATLRLLTVPPGRVTAVWWGFGVLPGSTGCGCPQASCVESLSVNG